MQVLYWLVASVCLAVSGGAMAVGTRCGDTAIVSSGWTAVETKHICASVQAALDWLRTMGVPITGELDLRPLDNRAGAVPLDSFGCYDTQSKIIQLLPFEASLQASRDGSSACGVPMTRELWYSYAAHETAHAAIEPYFAPGCPKRTASEYIAAVVQLATLPPDSRRLVLASYADLPAWGSKNEISSLYYFLNPCAFAVKSYRHFVSLPDDEQRSFIQRLLQVGLPN
jgi:hypothetical protein